MSVIRVYGLHGLKGKVDIQGSKNAVLPVMAASLLHRGITTITGVPQIQDVHCMIEILEYLGCRCIFYKNTLNIDTTQATPGEIPRELATRMRSSIMLLGPMLGRFGKGVTYHPGGCIIGKRPIDIHLFGLGKLGADIRVEGEKITATASKIWGKEITIPFPSVGATENIIMAAVAAEGTTVLKGAAREPEIEILCRYLTQAGADIEGLGSGTLVIQGRKKLQDITFAVPGDRIVAGTYLAAIMAAGGEGELLGAPLEHMESTLCLAKAMGAEWWATNQGVFVRMTKRPFAAKMKTGPYPDFPTDLQSVMMAVAATAQGESEIQEEIFEERFSTAKELQKMGAHIIIKNKSAKVMGVSPLDGAAVCARDLRGGAALVVAGLAARGYTDISGYGHISRGYEDICRDLCMLGAQVSLQDC